MDFPRMRTLPEAIAEIKQNDPETAFTIRALRRKVNDGEIPFVNIKSKKLVDMNVIYRYLSGEYIPTAKAAEENNGKIQPIY